MFKSIIKLKSACLNSAQNVFHLRQTYANSQIILPQRFITLVNSRTKSSQAVAEPKITEKTSLSDERNSESSISSVNGKNPFLKESPQKESIDIDKKRKILQLEVDVARQEGRRVPNPETIEDHHWKHLLSLQTRSARTKYYAYLWQIEKKKENKEIKKVEKLKHIEKRRADEIKQNQENNHIIYGLSHTSFFLRVYDSTINHWHNNKLTRAMQFGEKLVLDCSYDPHMNKREAVNTAKQLMLLFAENRMHDEPFDLHFCNANFNQTTMKNLQRHIPTMLQPEFPLNITEKCFTEVFPKEKLVYLTPHCKTDLVKYNPDDIYIIGAIVDKVSNEPLSLAKAKKLGIRMARLPLDRYLQWGSGSGKSLTLNQMVNIMLDVKKTGDWNTALRHVPKRKIVADDDECREKFNRDERKFLRNRANEFSVDSWASKKKGNFR